MSRPVPSPSIKGITGLSGTIKRPASTLMARPSAGVSIPLKTGIKDVSPDLRSVIAFDFLRRREHCLKQGAERRRSLTKAPHMLSSKRQIGLRPILVLLTRPSNTESDARDGNRDHGRVD